MPTHDQDEDLRVLVEADATRNLVASCVWEVLWGLGAACCLIATVVPAYLLSLNASKTLVQAITVGFTLFTGLQLFAGRIIHGPRRKLRPMVNWQIFTLCWITYGLAAIFCWDSLSSTVWTGIFVLLCVAMAITIHVGSPAYSEIWLENMPLKKRGLQGALRIVILGIFGVIGVWLAAWLMKQWPEPANFHVSFVVGGAILFVSCFSVFLIRDNAGLSGSAGKAPAPLMESIRTLLGNFNFRVFLIFFAFLMAGQSLAPLLIGYGKDVLSLPPVEIAWFTTAYFIGSIVSGMLFPRMADRYGFKILAVFSATVLIFSFLLPIVGGESRMILLTAYGLCTGSVVLNFIILPNLGAELVPEVKPSMIIGLASVLVMPLSFGTATLAGWLVDLHNSAGYVAVFCVGIVLAGCSLLGFILLVREPRTGQEIYIRIRRVGG